MFKSIKSKILVITLLGLFVLASAVAVVSINNAKDALMKKSFGALKAARDSKSEQLKNFFSKKLASINTLVKTKDVNELAYDMDSIEGQMNINEKGKFPIHDELVQNITKAHDSFFVNYMKENSYENIYLINVQTAQVVYATNKKSDYGTNLKTGFLKNSGLGEVFSKTLKNNKATFVDIRPYKASNNAPTMFLGAPVLEDGELTAILVFQISNKEINKVMKFRMGYGKSQEDYLVGNDYLMRSDSFLNPKTHSIKNSFLKPKIGNIKTKASIEALKGNDNIEIIKNYKNKDVLSAYSLVDVNKDLKWAIISEIDEEEVLLTPNKIRNQSMVISLLLLLVIAVLVYYVINKVLINPLDEFRIALLDFFKYLNKEQDEVELLKNIKDDEIGVMAKAVNESVLKTKTLIEEDARLINEVKEVVTRVKDGKFKQKLINNTSNENLEELKIMFNEMLEVISKDVAIDLKRIENALASYQDLDFTHRIKDASGKTSLGLNSLAQTINEMLLENKQNGQNLALSSDDLLKNVESLNTNSNESAAALEETAAAIEEISSNIINNTQNVLQMSEFARQLTLSANAGEKLAQDTTQAMNQIDEQVLTINESISVIDQISFQTNILSLNAAVEAATAGEAGKGFAVVAQEVRNLASRSAEAANEIKKIVENATIKANDGKNIAAEMIKGYNALNKNISKTIELISHVESASTEQKSGIEQINDAINSLDKKTQENANISNKTQEIAKQTDNIANLILKNVNEKEFLGK